jgi:hypothetical protein
MGEPVVDRQIVPNPRIPKVLGILNIVFASGMLLCGLCSGLYLAMLPTFARAIDQVQQNVEVKAKERRSAELKDLEEQEKTAPTEQEKAEAAARRKAVLESPQPAMPKAMNLKAMGLADKKVVAYYAVDFASGIVVNLLMLVAGIGLVLRKSWGLSLGVGTAALKIVRLVAVYGYFALATAPALAQGMASAAAEIVTQQQQAMGRPFPGGAPGAFLQRTYMIMHTLYAVGLIVFGSIYPAVSLWLLTRPGARAACSGGPAPQKPDNEW